MSFERLAIALLRGHQYYGPALRSLQGPPERHRCMQPVVAAAAANAGGRPVHVLEIGSWAGASAVSWATAVTALASGGRVLCVDRWLPYFDTEIEQESHYADMNAAAEHGDVFRLFLHNLGAAGVANVVEYKVGTSRDLLPQLEARSFDVIYVDGSHAVDDVLADLSQANRLIREGGILCGDDLELQRDVLVPQEHAAAVASGRDFVTTPSAGVPYHPGVSEAVARLVGAVFSWNGFWCSRRTSVGWEWLDLQPGPLPAHIDQACRDSVDDHSHAAPELIEQTALYNLVRLGSRYVAVHKALGPVSLGHERIGDRELPPHVLTSSNLSELRTRVLGYEQRGSAAD